MAAHLALNQEMGDRGLPLEPVPQRHPDGLWRRWKRAAFGASRPPVRVRPTRPWQVRVWQVRRWPPRTVPDLVSRPLARTWRVSSAGRAPDCRSGGRGFESRTRRQNTAATQPSLPGWCSGQHGGVRSPNRQFESGPGCDLAVAQWSRALPSEGRCRSFESNRRGFGDARPRWRAPSMGTSGFENHWHGFTVGVRFFSPPRRHRIVASPPDSQSGSRGSEPRGGTEFGVAQR
jgi:hypothetical protein